MLRCEQPRVERKLSLVVRSSTYIPEVVYPVLCPRPYTGSFVSVLSTGLRMESCMKRVVNTVVDNGRGHGGLDIAPSQVYARGAPSRSVA